MIRTSETLFGRRVCCAENNNDHHVMTDLGITIVVPNICLSHSKVDGGSIDPNNC